MNPAEIDFDKQPEGSEVASDLASPESQAEAWMRQAAIAAEQQDDWGQDDALIVEFYRHPLDGLDYVSIRQPGNTYSNPHFLAEPYYQQRFAKQWARYKQIDDEAGGEPMLRDMPWLDPASLATLEKAGIVTVNQLAGVTDNNLYQLGMQGWKLREKAQEERDKAGKLAVHDELLAKMQKMEAEIARLRDLAPRAPRAPKRP